MIFSENSSYRDNTEGFIHAYMHKDPFKFVKVGEGDKQGYYELDPEGIEKEMHVKNLIVTNASKLMANRMRPGTSWGSGIQYLELGKGTGTGTLQNPQPESSSQTALRQPVFRKEIDSWTYLDANNNPTGTPSNKLLLTTVFTATQANDTICEMGLFGGNASGTPGSGDMFNYKVFPVWNKQEGYTLTISWRLTF